MDRPESKVKEREEAALPRDAYALLAQANLLRMRGHWEEAAQKCMAALRLAPDSSSANSLLGDIYENQGRYDDAAQWYRMALDANPDSPADRVKLDRLRQREEAQREQSFSQSHLVGVTRNAAADKLVSQAASASRPVPGALQRLIHDPEIMLRFGAMTAALGLILVIVCAYTVVHPAGTFRAIGMGHEAVVKTTPVIVPPLAGVLPADADGGSARDPSEQSLLSVLKGSRDLSGLGITISDVQIDPRSSHATVTFGLSASAGLTQAVVARDALRVLQAASGQSPDMLTARCLLLPAVGNAVPMLAFVGDASREAVLASITVGAGLTDTQAEAVLTNAWWSSTADVRP